MYKRQVLYGNIVNIILDPLFIFYFGLGVEGAAWATALSQGCAMMLSLIHIYQPTMLEWYEKVAHDSKAIRAEYLY